MMKKATILLITIFIGSMSCLAQRREHPTKSIIENPSIPTNSNQFYFPAKTFYSPHSGFAMDTFTNRWYSQNLYALKEPIIFKDKSKREIYRFTWLETFSGPVAIRIEKSIDSCVLYWKICEGASGYKPGELIADQYRVIDKSVWNDFQKCLDKLISGI